MNKERAQAIVRDLVEARLGGDEAHEVLDALAIPRGEHVVGYGFVVRWPSPPNRRADLGWGLPSSLTANGRKYPGTIRSDYDSEHLKGETSILCRITAERILDSRGREIRRVVK